MGKGIAVAGNMIVDIIKTISAFPQRHELVKISEVSHSLGGAVNNVIQDLARLDPALPLKAIGLVGRDAEGDRILRTLGQYPNIDLTMVGVEGITSFTDVLTEQQSKARTFLMYPGASALLGRRHFDLEHLECDLFHIGYILLLEEMDSPDPEYGTQMAHLLHDVQERGILTSVDVVSEVSDRFGRLVPPSLRYADYFIVNEIESGRTVNAELRDADGRLLIDRIPDVLSELKRMGVRRWAVIHAPEGGFGMDERGRCVQVPSLALPSGFIAGTVGAGDAFCAGALNAAYRGESMQQALEDGIACAAASLRAPGASEGVETLDRVRDMAAAMPRQSLQNLRVPK